MNRFEDQAGLLQALQRLRSDLLKPRPESSGFREGLPRGLITIISPRFETVDLTWARLRPALEAGNRVIVKVSSQAPQALDEIEKRVREGGFDENHVALTAAPHGELIPFLYAHPAVSGLSFVGRQENASKIGSGLQPARTAFQAWTGGIHSFLILEPEGLDSAMAALVDLYRKYPQGSPRRPSRIFILDRFLDEAKEKLRTRWNDLQELAEQSHADVLERMVAEGAKILEAGPPALIENLPNCSEYQTQEWPWPMIQLTSVKYLHEMAKWVNTGFQGFMASLWGPQEKAEKLADKLEVGLILINTTESKSRLFGVKESVMGLVDLRPEGQFFSQRRILESKD